jgi:hypothetical protein
MSDNGVAMACDMAVESIRFHMEGELPGESVAQLNEHLKSCRACAAEFKTRKQVLALLGNTYRNKQISEQFDSKANSKLAVIQETGRFPETAESIKNGPKLADAFLDADMETSTQDKGALGFLTGRLNAAPWWLVSMTLHVLVLALASLISMTVTLPKPEDPLITVTELTPAPVVARPEPEKAKSEKRSALQSDHDTPPTDPTSKEESNIVVPPDIMAKAELGDHFETNNPDRENTNSAFGNPDAHMFHSEKGNAEEAGGGGSGGLSLEDSLIGVGGSSSPGSGGGWGGGSGTGAGIDKGSGHGSFGTRTGGGRKLMIKRHGGSPATESAVDRALEWLARHQEADGRWTAKTTEGDKDHLGCDPGLPVWRCWRSWARDTPKRSASTSPTSARLWRGFCRSSSPTAALARNLPSITAGSATTTRFAGWRWPKRLAWGALPRQKKPRRKPLITRSMSFKAVKAATSWAGATRPKCPETFPSLAGL